MSFLEGIARMSYLAMPVATARSTKEREMVQIGLGVSPGLIVYVLKEMAKAHACPRGVIGMAFIVCLFNV